MTAKIEPICLDIYDGEIPFSNGNLGEEKPFVEVFPANKKKNCGQAMLAFAGGGYGFRSKLSGSDYGRYFAEQGITTISVGFRLGSNGYDGRAILSDALASANLARKHADGWGFDRDKIGVIGTSAGGHLAGMIASGLAERFLLNVPSGEGLKDYDIGWRPYFAVYCYGVLSLLQPFQHTETMINFLGSNALNPQYQYWSSPIEHIDSSHCRSFLWHTAEDTEVSAENTLEAYSALRKHGVPCELHVYEKGPHALGLAQNLVESEPLQWAQDATRWIVNQPVALSNSPRT